MKILDRYVLRVFVSTLGLVILFVFGIRILIDLIGRVDTIFDYTKAIEAHGFTVGGLLLDYYLRSVPFYYLELAPFLTLIAATVAMIRLMQANEITPMVAAGRSPVRIALPLFVAAGVLSLVVLAIQEWVVPVHAAVRNRLEDMMDGDFETRVNDLSAIRDPAGSTWRINHFYPGSNRIEGVRALRFRARPGGPVKGSLALDSATWREDGPGGPGWYPKGAVLNPANSAADLLSPRRLPEDRPIETALDLEQVRVEYLRQKGDPSKTLSLSEAARIARLYPDVPEPTVVFHRLLTWPLANLLLLLLGLPLVLRFRKRNLLFGIGASLALCAAYFAISQIFADLGKRGEIPPAVAVWLPVILFTSLVAAILDFQRGLRPRRTGSAGNGTGRRRGGRPGPAAGEGGTA